MIAMSGWDARVEPGGSARGRWASPRVERRRGRAREAGAGVDGVTREGRSAAAVRRVPGRARARGGPRARGETGRALAIAANVAAARAARGAKARTDAIVARARAEGSEDAPRREVVVSLARMQLSVNASDDAGAEPQRGAQPPAMFKRLFGYPSSSKKASASTSIPRSPASGSPPAPASAPESSIPGRDDADLGRALFDALLAEPRLTAAKLTGSFVPKLTAHPARVPADLEKALRATLASHLNDPDADDDRVREACLHLLSTLALEPSNADFVLAALRDLDQTFERAFEREELYADPAPASNAPSSSSSSSSSSRHPPPHPRQLHVHLLRALLRCLGGQFTAFDLLEMSRDRADLAVAAALECVESASPPHATRPDPGDLPRLRAHACRLLHELTTPDAHFAEGERDAGIASLAAHFKRRCGDILRAALEGNALERLTRALAPASAEDAASSQDAEDAVRATTLRRRRFER